MHGSPQIVADRLVAPEDPPAVRPRVEPVGEQLDLDALARQDRLDQLVEAARDHERVESSTSSAKPGRTTTFSTSQVTTSSERRLDGRELALDHLVQRQRLAEGVLGGLVDADVAELEQHHVEAVDLRHGPVPVEDERGSEVRCQPGAGIAPSGGVSPSCAFSYHEYA